MKSLVERLHQKRKPNKLRWTLFNTIAIWQIKPLSVDIEEVIKLIELDYSPQLFSCIDEILIGDFKSLKQRQVSAAYMDGALYLSNQQKSIKDMIQDIVHELGHSLQENFSEILDRELEEEFLDKRDRVFYYLPSVYQTTIVKSWFSKSEFIPDMDEFLYKTLGYPALENISSLMFVSPYAVTSLEEYFANGLEHYLCNKQQTIIKTMCPVLHKKIQTVFSLIQED